MLYIWLKARASTVKLLGGNRFCSYLQHPAILRGPQTAVLRPNCVGFECIDTAGVSGHCGTSGSFLNAVYKRNKAS